MDHLATSIEFQMSLLLFSALAGYLPARLLGMSPVDAWVVGVGMAPCGEVAMVVALLALNEGIIQQPVFLSLVIMSLLTTVVVPLVFRNWLYRERGTELA